MDTITKENVTEKIHSCLKCGIYFEDAPSLEMHISMHSFTEKCLTEAELALRRKLLYQEVRKQQQNEAEYNDKISEVDQKPRRIYKPKSKRIGLTKIRMEDCLRCDACSCIYIEAVDYYKHMRNFHQKYNTIIPRCRRRSPIRTTIEDDYKPEDTLNITLTEQEPKNEDSFIDKQIREKIKNRWSEVVSQRLLPQTKLIKKEPEPDDIDMSLLLSNVEVTIKIEPPEIS